MKYNPEDYSLQDTMFYGFDETEIENYKEKLVKCRKSHKCNSCEKEIKPGERAIRESGFMDGEPIYAYTCTDCMDKWLDEINCEDSDDESCP